MSGYLTGRRAARAACVMSLMTTTAFFTFATPANASQLQGLRLAAPVSQIQQVGFRRAVGTAIAVGAIKRHFRKKDKKDKDADKDQNEDDASENSAAYQSPGSAQPASPGADASGAALSDEERAKNILAAEGSNVVKLHPLQLAAPDYDMVVCEAGCGPKGPHVVYKVAKTLVRSVTLDAKLPEPTVTKNADCQGGCEDNGTRSATSTTTGPAPSSLTPGTGDWMTAPANQPPAKPATIAPSAQAPSAPQKPIAAIAPPAAAPPLATATPAPTPPPATQAMPVADAPAALAPPAGTPPPTANAPKPLASSAPTATDQTPSADTGKPASAREDWLARINRERAATKAAPTTETAPAPKG